MMCQFSSPSWTRCLQISRMALAVLLMLASFQTPAQAQGKERLVEYPTSYRTIQIDGLSIFYREAGPKDAPTLLLLHGLPSSSRMFEPLFARLSDRYHLVAPDYPGFGHSDWPDLKEFAYTFDHIAEVMNHFTEALGPVSYTHLDVYKRQPAPSRQKPLKRATPTALSMWSPSRRRNQTRLLPGRYREHPQINPDSCLLYTSRCV